LKTISGDSPFKQGTQAIKGRESAGMLLNASMPAKKL
jgi:hypothetical protein